MSVADAPTFGPSPARERHVRVMDRWADCTNLPRDHPLKLVEFLNRQLNEEVNVLENAARNLVDFPEADWELRMAFARQCADEARHAQAYERLLKARGGAYGAFPVLNFQYRVLGAIPALVGRLAVQNRTFEADGLDAAEFSAAEARAAGWHDLAAMYDAQAADEVLHVRFANEWIKRIVQGTPRAVLDVAAALTTGRRGFEWVFAHGGTDGIRYPVAEDARRAAGFDEAEVKVSAEQARARGQGVSAGGRGA